MVDLPTPGAGGLSGSPPGFNRAVEVFMQPSDELVKLLASSFIARRDVKAIQSSDGAYRPIHEKWTMGNLRDHITGEKSYGHYTVDQDGKTKLFAFDIDLDQYAMWGDAPLCDKPACQKPNVPAHNLHPREVWKWGWTGNKEDALLETYRKQFRALGEGLASRAHRLLDIKTALAYSGSKGIHVYGFTGGEDSNGGQRDDVRTVALELLRTHTYTAVRGDNFWKHDTEFPHMTIEVFPKQEVIRAGDGLGNLMRLPLGRNLKGGRAFFLDNTAPEGQFAELDPIEALTFGCFDRG